MSTFDVALSVLTLPKTFIGKMTKKLAITITGGLSDPSKMPCKGWGTPAWKCRLGSKLAAIKGSVCEVCYARDHAYTWPSVRAAYQKRFERMYADRWIEAMVHLIRSTKNNYFRWFDSGDLDSVEQLRRIIAVCVLLPDVKFWLPTREYQTVMAFLKQGGEIPSNLTIRLSAHMKDSAPPTGYGLPTSTVHTEPSKMREGSVRCTAYDEKPHNCKACRACWDRTVANVSYEEHD